MVNRTLFCGLFTESAPRPIQSIGCNVHEQAAAAKMLYHLKSLITPIKKVPRSNSLLQSYLLHTIYEREVVSKSSILAKNVLKLPHKKKS